MDYVPKVDRNDVFRVVSRDFPVSLFETVVKLLDTYGTEKWHGEVSRVQLAALKLCSGNLDQLRKQIEVAKSDYRDVLGPAEYPRFWEIGFVGAERLSPTARNELLENDWNDYQSWAFSEE